MIPYVISFQLFVILPFIESSSIQCDRHPADIIFIIDSSSSVGNNNFHTQLDFVRSLVNSLPIGPRDMQVGVITFSNDVNEVIQLSQYQSKPFLMNAIHQLQYTAGGTHTDKALMYALHTSFSSHYGDRPSVRNFLIILTDGQSNVPAQTTLAAKAIHSVGIETAVIGIGNLISQREMSDIASVLGYAYQVSSFNDLFILHDPVLSQVCPGVPQIIQHTSMPVMPQSQTSYPVIQMTPTPISPIYTSFPVMKQTPKPIPQQLQTTYPVVQQTPSPIIQQTPPSSVSQHIATYIELTQTSKTPSLNTKWSFITSKGVNQPTKSATTTPTQTSKALSWLTIPHMRY